MISSHSHFNSLNYFIVSKISKKAFKLNFYLNIVSQSEPEEYPSPSKTSNYMPAFSTVDYHVHSRNIIKGTYQEKQPQNEIPKMCKFSFLLFYNRDQ